MYCTLEIGILYTLMFCRRLSQLLYFVSVSTVHVHMLRGGGGCLSVCLTKIKPSFFGYTTCPATQHLGVQQYKCTMKSAIRFINQSNSNLHAIQ